MSFGSLGHIEQIAPNAPRSVTSAIQAASKRTGVDFAYLLKQAKVESSFNPNAKAATSSATGLYQFTKQTWLGTLKEHGAAHGYSRYANAIHQNRDGTYSINSNMRSDVLNLRKDPKAASLMAAELAGDNHQYLSKRVGGDLSSTDLYMAHFLGANGASNFLTAKNKTPWAPAASMFPAAAKANKSVFYENGRPLSLQQVYNRFEKKFNADGGTAVVQNNTDLKQKYASRQIDLPKAQDWSEPSNLRNVAHSVDTYVRQNNASTLRTTHGIERRDTNPLSFIGNFLSSPVEIMLLSQTDFLNNNRDTSPNRRDRFNA